MPQFTETSPPVEQFGDPRFPITRHADDSYSIETPDGQRIVGLNRITAISYSAYNLANMEGKLRDDPQSDTLEGMTQQVIGSAGPVIETIFKAFTGPTTLSELANSDDISHEDVLKYQAIQQSTSLSTEQQAFVKGTVYKQLTKLDAQAQLNKRQSAYITQLAEEYKKHHGVNRKHIRGATAAFHEIAKSGGTLAAVINAFKRDKLSFASQGYDSVGYTIALTMGNIPVQIGLFAALAMGTHQIAIEQWKKTHKGKEPPAFLSTHPSSKKRIENLSNWINQIILEYPPIKT